VPFDGDVEYLINNEVVRIEKGYITLFWACTPHQLTRPGDCQQMAIFNLPMHLFLSWPLDRELINHVTHGMVIKSLAAQQLSAFEVRRWQQELSHENEQIRQLAIDEIALMQLLQGNLMAIGNIVVYPYDFGVPFFIAHFDVHLLLNPFGKNSRHVIQIVNL
jgi:hypothetical protein